MIRLSVSCRNVISVQPYKISQCCCASRPTKAIKIKQYWQGLWQPKHFLFLHNNMPHKPTLSGQRKLSNYSEYPLKNVLGAKRGLSWHSKRGMWTILANKTKTWRRQNNSSWYLAKSISSYQTYTCSFHDSRCWPVQEIWSRLSVHQCSVRQRQLSLIHQIAGMSKQCVVCYSIGKKARNISKCDSIFRFTL